MNTEQEFMKIAWSHHPGAMLQTPISHMESLEFIDFILDVEEKFAVNIPDEALEHVDTFGDALVILKDLVE